MTNLRRTLPALCLLAALAVGRIHSQAVTLSTTVSIAPTDKNLLYVGRWDRDDPTDAHGLWIGSYVRTRFTGTSVAVVLGGQTAMDVSIDAEPFRVVVGGSDAAPLNTAPLAPGLHTLQVGVKGGGGWDFKGLILDSGTVAKTPARRPIIEIIGDSVTCGSGSTLEAAGNYTWLTAQALGCDHTQISWPGRALTTGYGCAGDKRALDTQYFQRQCFYDSGPVAPWDFAAYTPRIVVINLGQNDGCGNEADDVFTASYAKFIQNIRAKFPHAQIVGLRMFGGGRFGDDTQKAVAAVNAAGDRRVHYIDTAGWLHDPADFQDGVHPSDVGGHKAAARLAPLLAPLLKGYR